MSREAEWRRQLLNFKDNRNAKNDLAAIVSLMDFMATTKGELHMTESLAHAHAARLAKVADTFRRLIEEGIEARVSKWSREAECDRLKVQLAKLKPAARCGDHGPGAHTAGPVETFIPEAL